MDDEMKKLLSARRNSRENGAGDELAVSAVLEADLLLRQSMGPGDARLRRRLVEYIVDPSHEVVGKHAEYHNFVMNLFGAGEYGLALLVCEHVLECAPYNRDMLGDAINACGCSSRFDRGEELLKRAMEIPYELWSFRLFLYGVEFLKTKLSAFPLEEGLFQRALALAGEYIRIFPYDGSGYNQKAELLLLMNRRNDAIQELNRFIFAINPDPNDVKTELIAAECCATLLDVLDDSNDYDLIIRICERGLRNTTQEQNSASIGYFVYRKALALDAKAHTQEFNVPATLEAALKFYQSAYDLNQDRQYGRTIEQRYAVLRAYSDNCPPLLKRSLSSEEPAGGAFAEPGPF